MRKKVVIAGFIGLMLLFVWLGGFMLFCRIVFGYTAAQDAAMPADRVGIVALTGGRNRIAKAVELLAAGKGERLLISGVQREVTLAQIAEREDITFSGCLAIDLGHEATDTVGNAKEIKTWAKLNRFEVLNVVTSFYHIPRARLELQHFLPKQEVAFTAVSSSFVRQQWWSHPKSFWFLAAEYTKFLVVYVQYNMLGL